MKKLLIITLVVFIGGCGPPSYDLSDLGAVEVKQPNVEELTKELEKEKQFSTTLLQLLLNSDREITPNRTRQPAQQRPSVPAYDWREEQYRQEQWLQNEQIRQQLFQQQVEQDRLHNQRVLDNFFNNMNKTAPGVYKDPR